jgi:hypothetical protein
MSHLEGEKIFMSEARISLLTQKGIHTNMTMLTFFVFTDTISNGIVIRAHDDGPLPIIGACCGINPIVTHNGGEVYESICGHGLWHIEHHPPKSNIPCSVL